MQYIHIFRQFYAGPFRHYGYTGKYVFIVFLAQKLTEDYYANIFVYDEKQCVISIYKEVINKNTFFKKDYELWDRRQQVQHLFKIFTTNKGRIVKYFFPPIFG